MGLALTGSAAVYNLKVVTDASPDYSDMASMIRSIASRWETPEEKCWAMFYWNHIARRQTAPMMLHGMALTDPIRQFNDYGYTMCSTISGINCSIWDAMGFKAKYWDISMHTVPEVEYGGRWHMYDNSMSALYTSCDGKTIAGVADIGREGACELSGGKSEPGHIARYHCLMGTSPKGFLTGADTIRSLDDEYRCFNPNGLKYRTYFYDWDRGHRYILNLRAGESYVRYYHSLGKSPEYYVPNKGKDPEQVNPRYKIRGTGRRLFTPAMEADSWKNAANSFDQVTAASGGGLAPTRNGQAGEVVYKVEGANVLTSLKIRGQFLRQTEADQTRILISTINGLSWKEVMNNQPVGEAPFELSLLHEINGSYEVLVKIILLGKDRAENARLKKIEFETFTMINSKTQPQLLLGKNTVCIGAGDPTESIVFWPDLQGDSYKPYVVEEKNLVTEARHPGYQGVMHAATAREEAYVVFRMDAPRDITRITYGGRLYNRAPKSHIDFLHSFDLGKTWVCSYSLTNTSPPWDVIHYETINAVPPGTKSVLFKYLLYGSAAGKDACSLYAVRMEANHQTSDAAFKPIEVTFNWSERQSDYSLVERSHTERITHLPHCYSINIGGADHPIVNSLGISATGVGATALGYSDGRDVGGEKFVPRWVTYGKNFALGKRYTVSVPSNTQWGAGDPEGTKLTDGIVGAPYPGGVTPRSALGWNKGQVPEITMDLGCVEKCGAFRIQVGAGYPWWDALKGQIKDTVEVLTSTDGQIYRSQGFVNLNLRWKNLPANHFWPDDEIIAAHLFELIPTVPQEARYVRYKITPARALTVSEVQVLDYIKYEPFDLRLALP